MQIQIGPQVFKSLAEARRHFRTMRGRYQYGERVSDADAIELTALLARHPDREFKLAKVIDHFTVGTNRFGTVSFFVIYADGSRDDFSFPKAIADEINTSAADDPGT